MYYTIFQLPYIANVVIALLSLVGLAVAVVVVVVVVVSRETEGGS